MTKKKSRRTFIKEFSALAITIPFLNNCTVAQQKNEISTIDLIKKNTNQTDCNWCGAKDVPDDVNWKTNLAEKNEKGEPLIISGTVYKTDGKTPAPDILIYAYHTDTKGLYGTGNEPQHGRFRGWVVTDKNGKYQINTIKPAPYPSRRTPAHIHYTLTGKNFKEDWVDSIFFKGDNLINDEIRRELKGKGGFQPIIKLEKKTDGILYGIRDIQLEKNWT